MLGKCGWSLKSLDHADGKLDEMLLCKGYPLLAPIDSTAIKSLL